MTEPTAEEIAKQVGQQIGQELNQGMDSLFTKLSGIVENATGTQVSEERTYDIGEGEAWKANMKRMFDEYQNVSLDGIGKNRNHFDKLVSDAQESDNRKRSIADQALQNAVETANMVGKQAVRHSDVAIDRQWNVDEQAGFVAKILNSIQDPAMATAMAAAVAKIMMENSGKTA